MTALTIEREERALEVLIAQFCRITEHGNEELPSSRILLCSSLSKAIASVTTYPHEVVRTRLQIDRTLTPRNSPESSAKTSSPSSTSSPRPLKSTGVMHTVRTIAKEEGLRGFYRGLGVNLIRTVPSSAMTILT